MSDSDVEMSHVMSVRTKPRFALSAYLSNLNGLTDDVGTHSAPRKRARLIEESEPDLTTGPCVAAKPVRPLPRHRDSDAVAEADVQQLNFVN